MSGTWLPSLLAKAKVRIGVLFGLHGLALNGLATLLARNPLDTYALATRAQIHLLRTEHAAALADLRATAQASDPTDTHSSHAWYNLGYLLNEQGQLAEAETAFRTALSIHKDLDLAWYGLGLVLIKTRRFDDAADALKRNTQLQPMSPYGWYQLARVHVDRQKPDEARKVIAHLRAFEPKVADQLVRETGITA